MASENLKNSIHSKVENPIFTTDIQRHKFEKKIVENFILIWLDKNIYETFEQYENPLQLFQLYINTIKLFSNPNEFYEFIQNIKEEKLFIITSGTIGEKIIPHIETQTYIHSIYIYCNNREHYEKWTKDIQKVKGVYTDLQSIRDAFRRDIRQANNDLISISILPNINSNELKQSFICSLLLKEILIHSESNEQKKIDFIEYSHFHYNENFSQLNIINQYKNNTYNQISPIEWYTRECFIYSMINRTLRLYDIEILNKISFFIHDLHEQIKYLHMKINDNKKLIVYYGQGILNEQFNQLYMNINGLICFNNFLLTTINKESSYVFAKQSENDINLVCILFQIEINYLNTLCPFIKLDELDYYHDTDQYILFSLNPIFQINKIERIENKLWQINLILIDNNNNKLKDLTYTIQKKYEKSNEFYLLGQIIFEMNDLIKAKYIFEILLQNTMKNKQKNLYNIHRMLGRINQKMNNFPKALFHYQECINIQSSSHTSSKDFLLSPTFAAIGAILEKLGDYNEAMKYFQQALNHSHYITEFDSSITAIFYINIGRIFYKQKQNLEAQKNFQLALKFQQNARIHDDNLLTEINYYLAKVS
ncbi:unnamed protein product [Rotaria sp. Silwood1]|nr:unnamed protein product [Rotaria sp. Silwood1]CAF3529950.1 unnamed protein product [Rotaria sp. Silwood1]CAF4959869.1 unnamed protein product [Rotaria sp. Silwood1]